MHSYFALPLFHEKQKYRGWKSEVINFSLHESKLAKLIFSHKYHDIPKEAFYQINPYFKSKPVCCATPVYFQLSAPLQSRCCQCTTYTWLTFWHMKWGLMYSKMINYGIFADVWLKKKWTNHRTEVCPCFFESEFFWTWKV